MDFRLIPQLMVDAVPVSMSYIDIEQRYRFVNRQCEEWFGCATNIVGRTIKDILGVMAYQEIQDYVEAVLSGEKVSYKQTLVDRSGKVRYVQVDYIPHISEAKVLGFFVLSQDLTECKQAEEVLRRFNTELENQVQERTAQLQQALKFEAMLKRITDKVRDSLDESQIFQTTVQELAQGLEVIRCNTAWYNVAQTTATVCYEYTTSLHSFQGKVVQTADFDEFFSQLLKGQHFQFCYLGKDESWRNCTILACPIVDDQGVLGDLCLFKQSECVFNDSEIRLCQQVANQCAIAIRQARLYQAQREQVLELKKLNQLKDDFLSTVSHELRTPMTKIKMAIHMLDLALSRDSKIGQRDQTQRYLQILQDECTQEISLINDLLDLQKLEAGSQPLVPQTIHLQTWLLQIIEPYRQRVRHAEQILQLDIPSTLPPLFSEPYNLKRILVELLNNACKYTPAGERIVVLARATPSTIQLQVINSGTEIPERELPRVFDKFYRLQRADPWKQGGTGMGLALVQKLVELLGGGIRAESHESLVTFTVELPLHAHD